MDIGNRILLLRYSDFHGVDTIAEHKKVISSKGHCWWAKIGKQPSEKYLKSFLLQEEKIVLLAILLLNILSERCMKLPGILKHRFPAKCLRRSILICRSGIIMLFRIFA